MNGKVTVNFEIPVFLVIHQIKPLRNIVPVQELNSKFFPNKFINYSIKFIKNEFLEFIITHHHLIINL